MELWVELWRGELMTKRTAARNRRSWLGLITALLIMLGALPAQAMQVSALPQSPVLGDTIRVEIVAPQAPPQVRLNGQTFPAFEMVSGRWRALLPTSPLDRPGSLLIQASDGAEVQNLTLNLGSRSFPTQRIWLTGSGGAGLHPIERERVAQFRATVTPERFWNGLFRRPSAGRISAVYGVRRYYNGVFAQDYYHRGVDYAAATGTPIVAPAAGRVLLVGREAQGFRVHGNCVGIDHGQGVLSIFLHLSRIHVQAGQLVQSGQTIGAIGTTGASTGPHLHWGLYVNGVSVDPGPWRYGYGTGHSIN